MIPLGDAEFIYISTPYKGYRAALRPGKVSLI